LVNGIVRIDLSRLCAVDVEHEQAAIRFLVDVGEQTTVP